MTAPAAGTAPAEAPAERQPWHDAPIGYTILPGHPDWAHLAKRAARVADIEPGFVLGAGFDQARRENRQGYDVEQAWLPQWAAEAAVRARHPFRTFPDIALPPAWQWQVAIGPGPPGVPEPAAPAARSTAQQVPEDVAEPAEDSPPEATDSIEGDGS